MGVPFTELDPVPDHRSSRLGKGLAGGPTGDDLDPGVLDDSADAFHHVWIGEIPVEGQAGEVVRMRRDSRVVVISAEHYSVTGLLQTEADPAGAGEQIGREMGATIAQRLGQTPELRGVGCVVVVRRELEERTADQFDAVRRRLSGHGHLLRRADRIGRRVCVDCDSLENGAASIGVVPKH